ncbi:hypothetical protein GQ54DRAFT_254655 [Martensiomyces pterosporus]|nr:hypothetical protein GQ54DRAFT_254655 [Martensiomyces pterosporus]
MANTTVPGSPLLLSKADFLQLQDISSRIKAIREPIRELMRTSIIAGSDINREGNAAALRLNSDTAAVFERVKEQLEITQNAVHACLQTLSGSSPTFAAGASTTGTSTRPASSKSSVYSSETSKRSSRTDHKKVDALLPAADPVPAAGKHYSTAASSIPVMPTSQTIHRTGSTATTATNLQSHSHLYSHAHSHSHPPAQLSTVSSTVEKAIHSTWHASPVVFSTAVPVNEAYARLDKRHLAPLVERIPQIPSRELATKGQPGSIIDLVNSLFRSSARDGAASVLTRHLESIPPGIAACAIANSASQIFQQLTVQSVLQYSATSRASRASSISSSGASLRPLSHSSSAALRMLSDHANFLTRLAERTILYPMHAAQRAKRIEWWTIAACLLRELGDYESLSSLVCVFSGPIIGRLKDTWDQVSSQCKSAIRFILDRVLKIHPNYSSYRDELQTRIARMRRSAGVTNSKDPYGTPVSTASTDTAGNGDQMSLDFDNAVSIDSPELRASSESSNVNSPVYCRECRDLPPMRALVPVVAVLLKDAATADALSDSVSASDHHGRNKAHGPGSSSPSLSDQKWMSIMESAADHSLPLNLDNNMLRRIFYTEPPSSSAASSASPGTPRAISAATSFLRRVPRRSSASEKQHKDGGLPSCRLASEHTGAPTIIDMLAHLLALASGNPCFACSVGSPLNALHVSTSGQMAVMVAAILMFSEPWMPQEYIFRLCEMREPRVSPSPFLTKTAASIAFPQPVTPLQPLGHSSAAQARMQQNEQQAQPADQRTADSPWLMSFKVSDSSDSARYLQRTKSRDLPDDSASSSRPTSNSSTYTRSGDRAHSSRNSTNSTTNSSELALASGGYGHHKRSPSSHSVQSTISKRTPSVISQHSLLPELPPLPSNSRPPPLPSAGMPASAIPPLPAMPPLSSMPMSSDPSPAPPPLPSMPMPKGPGIAPPPLPSQPMPKFQPDSIPQPYSTLTRTSRTLSASTAAAQLSDKPLQRESLSAETQMLLNFNSH